MKKLSVCLGLLLLNASYAQSMFKGSEGGGGGDASEERVSEIRSDILSWIQKGGSTGLELPDGISLNEYNQKMSELLQPKAVVVTFVANNDSADEELQVNVDGKPKTCRGFFSRINAKPHMICNISRFRETSPSDQYKLIHHEYAGLAYLEKNDGAASDYVISNQITEYLEKMTVLKLALKKAKPSSNKVDGLCVASYKTKSNTSGPSIRNIVYHSLQTWTAPSEKSCMCAISKSIDILQKQKVNEVKKVKVFWNLGKIVGNFAVYEQNKSRILTTEEVHNFCNE